MAGAPKGNNNAVKSKPWTDAIRKEIIQRDIDKPDDAKFLRLLAKQLLEDCLNGDKAARDELSNRLDGRYPQPIVGDDELPPVQVQAIERRIID